METTRCSIGIQEKNIREQRMVFQGKVGEAILQSCCTVVKEGRAERKGLEEELYNKPMWTKVSNGSIIGLIEFPLVSEENKMDSSSFPFCLFIPSSFHLPVARI